MKVGRALPLVIAGAAGCSGLAALQQPRPAAAAFLTFLAFVLSGCRWMALAICAVVAIGLVAAIPSDRPVATPPTMRSEPR